MQKLRDYPILDFTGGIRTDKSPYQLKDNEMPFVSNMILEPGRATKRYGNEQYGAFADIPDADEVLAYGITYNTLTSSTFFLANQNTVADNGMVYVLGVAKLSVAASVGDTTLTVVNNGSLQTTGGLLEINGDVITYSGLSGTTGVTGVTFITSAHAIGSAVRQWRDLYAAARDTSDGTWFAYLNSLQVISHGENGGYVTVNGATVTNRLNTGAPFYINTYKQRVYGRHPGVGTRVVFSNLNDPTGFGPSLYLTNYFDVEDDRAEPIVNMMPYAGREMIFKRNSTFYYNLSQLVQAHDQVGTWNDQTVREINGLLYTFCPIGVFVGNGSSWKDISKPVKKFVDAYTGKFVNVNGLVANKVPRMGVYDDKMVLWLGSMTIDQVFYASITLVYDTHYKSWTIWTELDNMTALVSVQAYIENYNLGGAVGEYGASRNGASLFYANTSQNLYRMFDNYSYNYTSGSYSGGTVTGGPITYERLSDTSQPIPCQLYTKFYHQNAPGWWKQFRYLRVLCELWPFDVEVRTLTGKGFSNWKPLGQVTGPNQVFKIDLEGYAIQIRVVENSKNEPMILNGFILEETMAISKNYT